MSASAQMIIQSTTLHVANAVMTKKLIWTSTEISNAANETYSGTIMMILGQVDASVTIKLNPFTRRMGQCTNNVKLIAKRIM